MPTDFDDMEKAEVEPLWANLGESIVTLEDEGEIIEEVHYPLVGVIRQIKKNVGENDSRLYFISTIDHDRPIAIWGKADLDQKIDTYGLGVGDEIGIKHTGETRETAEGEMTIYEVRYRK